jgi:hypothetical protein
MLFGLLGKEEKHFIDGREIEILSRAWTGVFTRKRMRQIILEFCASEKIATFFPKLTFVLELSKKVGGGVLYVREDEMVEGKSIVHVVTNVIGDTGSWKGMEGFIVHELTHLKQYQESKLLTEIKKVRGKLHSSLKKLDGDYPLTLKEFRIEIKLFVYQFFSEGLATFAEKRYKGLNFSAKNQGHFYKIAKESMQKLKKITLEYYEIFSKEYDDEWSKEKAIKKSYDKLTRWWQFYSYYIGLHMVYTILFVDHKTTIEDILKLKFFQFFRKYEACMKIHGRKPVFSISSRDGILDYNLLLAEWQVMMKKMEKR